MIHLICGSTGAGKTSYAMTLAKERGAIRFTVDEWMKTLFFPDLRPPIKFEWAMERIERCEAMMWIMCRQLLGQGKEVVLEISMSTRTLRDKHRGMAKALGSPYRLHYLDVDKAIRRARIRERNKNQGDTFAFEVNDDMFDFVEAMFEPPSADELAHAEIIRAE